MYKEYSSFSGLWSHTASSLQEELKFAFADGKLCSQTVISWAHADISFTHIFNTAPFEGPEMMASNIQFCLCPLYIQMSSDSLNLLMLLSTVDDEMFKVFATLWWQIWKCSWLFCRFLNLCPALSMRDCLSKVLFFIPKHVTDLLQRVPPASFLYHLLFQPFVVPVATFLKQFAAIKFKMS